MFRCASTKGVVTLLDLKKNVDIKGTVSADWKWHSKVIITPRLDMQGRAGVGRGGLRKRWDGVGG